MAEGLSNSGEARQRAEQLRQEIDQELAKYTAMFKQGRKPGDDLKYDHATYNQAINLIGPARGKEVQGDFEGSATMLQQALDLLRQAWITQ